MQCRNRDIDVENGHVDTGWEGEGGTNWEITMDIYTLPCVKIDSQWEHAIKHRELSSVLYDDLVGWDGGWEEGREVQERRDICIHIADSLHCTAETNTTL